MPADPALTPDPRWYPTTLPTDGTQGCIGVLKGDIGDELVSGVALSHDLRSLFSLHVEGKRRRWDLTSGQPVWQTGETLVGWCYGLALAPDGHRLAAGAGDDGTIAIFAADDGRWLRTLTGHSNIVEGLAWSPDGDWLASASRDRTIRIWSTSTWECAQTLTGLTDNVNDVAWSPDGQRLAATSSDGTVSVFWERRTGTRHCTIEKRAGTGRYIESLAWSPDGRLLVTGSASPRVRVWDADSGRERLAFNGHHGDYYCAVWSWDGRCIASGAGEDTLRIWSADSGAERDRFTFPEKFRDGRPAAFRLAWAADGSFLVSSHFEDTIRLWDTRHLVPPPPAAARPTGALLTRYLARQAATVGRAAPACWTPADEASVPPPPRLLGRLPPLDPPPTTIAWSPDGARLAVGDHRGNVGIVTTEGRRIWLVSVFHGTLTSVIWSPDGGRLACVAMERRIRMLDARMGRVLQSWPVPRLISAAAFSPDGRRIVMPSAAGIRIVDVETGGTLIERDIGSSGVALGWSPSGTRIAVDGPNQCILICDATTLAPLTRLVGERTGEQTGEQIGAVTCLEWSDDETRLLTGFADGGLSVFEVSAATCLSRFRHPAEHVRAARWFSEEYIVSLAADDVVRRWSSTSGRDYGALADPDGHPVIGFAAAPGGDQLALLSTKGTISLWHLESALPQRAAGSADIPIPRDAARSAAPDRWVPRFENADTPGCLGRLPHPPREGAMPGLALSADARTLFVGHNDGRLRAWDLTTGTPRWQADHTFDAHIVHVALSPDGTRVAASSAAGAVAIWDAATGRTYQHCEGAQQSTNTLAWSPDGRLLAGVSVDAMLRVWDAASGGPPRATATAPTRLFAVAWSPAGDRIITGGKDGHLIVWAADSLTERGRMTGHQSFIPAVSCAPDGRRLASAGGDGTVRLWDLATGAERACCRGHQGDVEYVAWSPDGRLIASCGFHDNTIRLWDPESASERHRWSFPTDDIYTWRLAWAPGGAFLVSSHDHDTVLFWDTRPFLAAEAGRVRASAPGAAGWAGEGGQAAAAARDGDGGRPAAAPAFDGDADPAPPAEVQALPAVAAALHRLGQFPPLSLVRDLLALTAGRSVEGAAGRLASHRGMRALAELGWRPVAARTGLCALALREMPALEEFTPPAGTPASAIAAGLAVALAGPPIPPQPPAALPLAALDQALDRVDDRLLTLLAILGPEAVAADPGLGLRLSARLPALPALARARRALLAVPLAPPPEREGGNRAQCLAPAGDHVGLGRQGPLNALLPSQLALDDDLFEARLLRRELLFRTRSGQEPPRLRPTVLVLDVSPPCFGPIEAITRPAAHLVAATLIRHAVPALLITAGGRPRRLPLQRPADLLELWTSRSLEPADPLATLTLAAAWRDHLTDGPLTPVILLLTQPWFAADLPPGTLPTPQPGLRALTVASPCHSPPTIPPLADHCETCRLITPTTPGHLPQNLPQLLAGLLA